MDQSWIRDYYFVLVKDASIVLYSHKGAHDKLFKNSMHQRVVSFYYQLRR